MNIPADEANTLTRAAITAVRNGNIHRARALLIQAIDTDPSSVEAWMWRAGVAETATVRRFCLKRALALDPRHGLAHHALAVADVQPTATTPDDTRGTATLLSRTPRSTSPWRNGPADHASPVSAPVALRGVAPEPDELASEPTPEHVAEPTPAGWNRVLRPWRTLRRVA